MGRRRMRLALCYTIVSAENKMLLDSAKKRGAELERIVDSEALLAITGNGKKEYDAIRYAKKKGADYYDRIQVSCGH